MKKIVSLILTLVLGVVLPMLSLSSCDTSEDDVSVLYYTYSDTYISSVRSSVDKEWRARGIGYHNYDANGVQTTQTEQVDTAITKGTKVLAVNLVDSGSEDAAKAIIEKARAKNIPVIFDKTAKTMSFGECVDKMASARRGPTLEIDISFWKKESSSVVKNPKISSASSRIWVYV